MASSTIPRNQMIDAGTLRNITALSNIPVNTYGYVGITDASINPRGNTTTMFAYINFGTDDRRCLICALTGVTTGDDEEVYVNTFHTNRWNGWRELYKGALEQRLGRVQFPAINTTGYVEPIGSSYAKLKLTVQNYSRILFLAFGNSNQRIGTLMIAVNSAGTVYTLANLGNQIQFSTDTNHLEISCTLENVGFYVHPIVFSGGFTVET